MADGMRVQGSDLRIGDTIETWFSGGRDTITSLRPYRGQLACLFPAGAQIASFALNRTGMTIDNGGAFNVLFRAPTNVSAAIAAAEAA